MAQLPGAWSPRRKGQGLDSRLGHKPCYGFDPQCAYENNSNKILSRGPWSKGEEAQTPVQSLLAV